MKEGRLSELLSKEGMVKGWSAITLVLSTKLDNSKYIVWFQRNKSMLFTKQRESESKEEERKRERTRVNEIESIGTRQTFSAEYDSFLTNNFILFFF